MPIFDQGYQHWNGAIAARTWRSLAIARHGVRVGMAGRAIRLLVLASWLPALLLAVMLCLWGLFEQQSLLAAPLAPVFQMIGGSSLLAQPRTYRVEIWTLFFSYYLSLQLSFAMILLLVVGPSLISQDLRFNALPLYLSRPLKRIDYFLGKLGVVAAFLGMVIVAPSLLAYLLGIIFSLDLTVIRDTYRIVIACVAFGLLVAFSAGTLMLALSSTTRSSRFVALFWLCVWLVSGAVSLVFNVVHEYELRRSAWTEIVGERTPGMRFNADVRRRVREKASEKLLAGATSDWRPLVSYRANLARLGDEMLGTNGAVQRLSELQPEGLRATFAQSVMGAQYPWQWSVGVLAVIFGISVCILNLTIKSLDRLK